MEKNLKQNERRGQIIAYASLVIWIGVIFYMSSGQGSMTETSRFIKPLLEFLFPAAPEELIRQYHGYIRKFAHFAEYAVLALLVYRAFSLSLKGKLLQYVLPLVLVLTVASLDEINQSFVASRTGTWVDVVLDLSGGVTAILAIWLWGRGRRGKREISSR